MKVTPRIIGLSVQQARKEAAMTQAELANKVRVSRKWLSELENGKAELNLGKVLNVLSVLGYSLHIEKQSARESQSDGSKK